MKKNIFKALGLLGVLLFCSCEGAVQEESTKVYEETLKVQEEVDSANESFAKWEKVKQFRLTPDIWSIGEGHLTPTMKLRRKIIKGKYMDLYNDIYGH